jgi:hypothetical protein
VTKAEKWFSADLPDSRANRGGASSRANRYEQAVHARTHDAEFVWRYPRVPVYQLGNPLQSRLSNDLHFCI